jgi:Sec-independent protein secretion pathway component TatC
MVLIAISFPFASEIVKYLIGIYPIKIEDMTVFSPTEFIRLKIYISLILAILISHPLWYRGVYNFSESGLTEKEKKAMVVSFSLGSLLFLIGGLIGLQYLSPFLIDLLLEENGAISANLSIYQSISLLVTISLFSGILTSLPILILLVSDYLPNKKTLKKYIYILIILVIALGTPEPSMIINLIFLIFFAAIMEVTLLFMGAKNAN